MSALSKWFQPWSVPLFGETTCTVAPAAFSAFTGFGQLHLFDAIRRQDGDILAIQFGCHAVGSYQRLHAALDLAHRLHDLGDAGEFVVRHAVQHVHDVLLGTVLLGLLHQIRFFAGKVDALQVVRDIRGRMPTETAGHGFLLRACAGRAERAPAAAVVAGALGHAPRRRGRIVRAAMARRNGRWPAEETMRTGSGPCGPGCAPGRRALLAAGLAAPFAARAQATLAGQAGPPARSAIPPAARPISPRACCSRISRRSGASRW